MRHHRVLIRTFHAWRDAWQHAWQAQGDRGCSGRRTGMNGVVNLTIYLALFGGMIVACVFTASFFRVPTRPCHRCGNRVKLANRRCRHCRYEFSD
jgi:hypothetical protein